MTFLLIWEFENGVQDQLDYDNLVDVLEAMKSKILEYGLDLAWIQIEPR